jgi:hypothetical protein
VLRREALAKAPRRKLVCLRRRDDVTVLRPSDALTPWTSERPTSAQRMCLSAHSVTSVLRQCRRRPQGPRELIRLNGLTSYRAPTTNMSSDATRSHRRQLSQKTYGGEKLHLLASEPEELVEKRSVVARDCWSPGINVDLVVLIR